MTYEVRLAPRAVRDLRHLYLEKRVETSHHAAVWFIGLEAAVFSLETMPQRCVATPENAFLRHLLYGKKPHVYRIIYSIDEQLRQEILRKFAMAPANRSLLDSTRNMRLGEFQVIPSVRIAEGFRHRKTQALDSICAMEHFK